MIKQGESKNFKGTRVLITNDKKINKSILSELSKSDKSAAEEFAAGKSDFDYAKNGEQFLIFVRGTANLEKIRVSASKVRTLISKETKAVAIVGEDEHSLAFAEGLALSNYQFIHYFKDAEAKKNLLSEIVICAGKLEKKITQLNNVIKATLWARTLVNEPVSFLTAVQLAKEIEIIGEETGIRVQVLEKNQIEALKMGGLLSVNKGSQDPPTFTIIEYKPKKATNKKPIVLIGKGVVYDTGGLSLKPTKNSMDLMKCDMAGAAAAAGAIYAAALNKLDLHIIGLIPATDNRPGENAYTPGDVIRMYNGTTVEVLNTDAEGRMILADALTYSNKLKPELVIDLATLTGAAVAAIGSKAAIFMGNAPDSVFAELEKAGNTVHERLVRFPFWDEYLEDMKSSIADLKNVGGPTAGMITAGKFLETFVDSPYVHIDIAGPAFLETGGDYKGKGGTGFGIRLLHEFLQNH